MVQYQEESTNRAFQISEAEITMFGNVERRYIIQCSPKKQKQYVERERFIIKT